LLNFSHIIDKVKLLVWSGSPSLSIYARDSTRVLEHRARVVQLEQLSLSLVRLMQFQAERTDRLDARAALDLFRTFFELVPRTAFAPYDDAARAAAACQIACLNEEGRLFARAKSHNGPGARGDSFREVVARFERVLKQSRDPPLSQSDHLAEKRAAGLARELAAALAATMPAPDLPPPLERPLRRDVRTQHRTLAQMAAALTVATDMPPDEERDVLVPPPGVMLNERPPRGGRRRDPRTRWPPVDSDSSDAEDPLRHRRRTPSQELVAANPKKYLYSPPSKCRIDLLGPVLNRTILERLHVAFPS
jgi:hypothetical protein